MTALKVVLQRTAALRDESGSALGVAVILLFFMLVTALALMQLGGHEAVLTMSEVRYGEAFFLAESGLQQGEAWLEAQDQPPDETLPFYPFGEDEQELGNGSYTVTITPDPDNTALYPNIYTITSVASVGRRTRTLEVDLMPGSFADYLYFTDREQMPGGGGRIWFCGADAINGPLHTNDQISIMGDPLFVGCVRSAYGGPDDSNPSHEPKFMYYNGSQNDNIELAEASNPPNDEPVFEDGFKLGTPEIEYPHHNAVFDLRDVAVAGGVSISGDYEIVLSRADEVTGDPMYGYVSYKKPGKTWNDVDLSTINGVLFINGGAEISGVLDGELTVVTTAHIDIVDDVTYRGSDENGPAADCDDVLGLIAGTDINVVNNAANRNDCEIHAAMMALANSFRAGSYNTGGPRGTLTVHGSIIQSYRGPVGTGTISQDGTVHIHTGYSKDYHYDERLRYQAPPGFFQTGRYTRLAWREVAG